MINVTKPFLPPIDEYIRYLEGIWKRDWLTNHGPLVNELEQKLKEYLDVPYLYFVSNGTIGLQIAIKAIGKTGEIITTPFSYVATTSSIVWQECKPVFVDIDYDNYTINSDLIESSITEKTIAILPTHVYGIPCDVEKIQKISEKHHIPVIYDGAHAFGTSYKNRSIFQYGDISIVSFHATKLFHTVEGGAIMTKNKETAEKISYLRNFGHDGPNNFVGPGINGKNSEFHAAMGLCNLKYIDRILDHREKLWNYYREQFKDTAFKLLEPDNQTKYNHAYFPILFPDENQLLHTISRLEKMYIYARRYFYPSLEDLNYVGHDKEMPVSSDVASRILCLPLYYELTYEEVDMIVHIVLNS